MVYSEEYTNLDVDNVFKEITYDEFMNMFEHLETGIVLLGGAWCKNAQIIVPYANTLAKKKGLDVIYNFDLKYENELGRQGDLRTGTSLDHRMEYFNIAEKTGIQSDTVVENTMMPRIPSPTFIAIKNGTTVGYFTAKYIHDEMTEKLELSSEDMLDFAVKFTELVDLIKGDNRFDI
ncbi:MAG: hypothetical protein SPJ17_05080 [Anaeroplasma sp.]|uniref:hypothetical protein n=1 Tax=Anaeroplasma sp. TaxID=1872523 RepID=UPI002A91C3E7|nr:hypothetical protein [Anaeroplasma sp.]MDY5983050.1 hypothetical protein [Anaeroplasma sp.]